MSSLHLEKKGMNTGNLEGKGVAEKQEGVEESREQEAGGQNSFSEPSGSRQGLKDKRSEPRRVSVLPLQWRITHSSRWIAQVLASELSLVAFALLLVMVFSKKWLYPSRSRFYQRWPTNVSAGIYTATHVMSMGLLEICRSNGCFHSENWKVFLIFFTMMLFPINLWIFELKKNLSVPIGWSYFIGWLVFVLYVTCAALCYFNHKHFWRVILSHPAGTMHCSNFSSPKQNLKTKPVVSHSSGGQRDVRDPEQKEASP
ncbi:outer dense fiber protein 4 [Mustela nigripes]|uniref:outer dense fiber protein 4 n=1 Tax=Mustela nigripes TaxID=77151 RepID=UPI002814AFD6|nr:outer dense fiber protein 4 [Mustela nigripes]